MRVAVREHTIGRITHPDPLRILGSPHVRTLIVDPIVDRIAKGDPLLGWEGDDRLALYLNVPTRTFELWRLEHDNVYRLAATRDADSVRVPDLVPQLIVRLIVHDSRRGFDPTAAVNTANAAAEAVAAKAEEARTEEFALRLRHALRNEDL